MRNFLHGALKVLFIALFLAGVVLVLGIFTGLGQDFLKGTPEPSLPYADAAVVLAGGPQHDRQRLARGIALVRQGRANYLILPLRDPALDWTTLERLYRLDTGIPPERVYIGRPYQGRSRITAMSGGTYAEAVNTVEIMRGHGLRSALVVSSDYHIRRVQLAFSRVLQQGDLVLAFEPVLSRQPVGLASQLRSRGGIILEYGKLAAAWCMYPGSGFLAF